MSEQTPNLNAESGTGLKIIGNLINEMFAFDKNGCLIASVNKLQVEKVARQMSQELRDNKDLERTLLRKTYTTDVQFADRPAGSTPVIAYGIKLFGPSPQSGLKFEGRISNPGEGKSLAQYYKQSAIRNKRINKWVERKVNFTKSLQPSNEQEEAIKEIEMHQILTGGGYDNTKPFSITRSCLDFLNKSSHPVDLKDSWRSSLLMESVLALREELWQELGIPLGSLRVESLQVVRYLQDSDGMMGWPAYCKARVPLTKTIAERISRNTGVSVMGLVRRMTTDPNTGEERPTYVVDAVAYALDRMVVRADDLPAIITTLARIQRHGYKEEDDKLVMKDGKARSVSPNSLSSGAQEAMAFQPFIDLCKEKRVHWLPSLQDKPTRVSMMKAWYTEKLVPKKYRALAADWSGYDKTVDGSVLATILYYIVRPLYHSEDQQWVDLAIIDLVYKYFIVSKTAASVAENAELFEEVKKNRPWAEISDEYIIVGTENGLGSGAKMTHVGGSLYGETIVHYCIPKQLGWEPVSGPQAGDDTSLGAPLSFMHLDSAAETYQPIADAAAEWNLEMNVQKQTWVVYEGEPVNVLLQENYSYNLDMWGIGTAGRYCVAGPFAERDKGLKIGEQYMAVFSKWNNGWDNPFIHEYVRDWLLEDDFICVLFKEYGVSAFDMLVASTGSNIEELTQELELEYNWGLSKEQLLHGDIPILAIIAEEASKLSPRMSLGEALKFIENPDVNANQFVEDPVIDDEYETEDPAED